ncbi:MAG TPA: XdhC family protein [Gemmatimonadaceae bacterium]|nr:XdhC family protein [Gemmatimonadaceae bacterium]
MDELFTHLDQLRRSERRVAMATLVATRGTTPRREGAKMWVGEGGRILGSVTIGGCVDARVIAEADEVIATARPKLLSMSLGDEDAWDLGLTCSGTLDVLLEPVDFGRADDAVLGAYDIVRGEAESRGEGAVIVTPLERVGGRLVVLADGSLRGTLGDPALDDEARRHALGVLREGRARTIPLGAARAPAFFEVHAPPATLVIFGATHVAQPLTTMARALGWRTVVVDGREHFATRERFPDADELHVANLGDFAERLRCTPSTFVVLTAHDYKYELPVLRAVLAREPAYIGLLGSRRRGEALRDFLRQEGVDEAALRRIHVPVGLDIGAATAPEIALSVLAEAVATRAGRDTTRRSGR